MLLAFEAAGSQVPEDLVFMLRQTLLLPSLQSCWAVTDFPKYLGIFHLSDYRATLITPTDVQGTWFQGDDLWRHLGFPVKPVERSSSTSDF